jgi:hypothetical protein
MKVKNVVKRLLLTIILAGCCIILAGCVLPDFSATVRSPDVRGRVVDSESGRSLQNTRIFWSLYTNEVVTTDTNGSFHLPGARNQHYFSTWLYGGIYGFSKNTYPQDARPCDAIVISRPGYDSEGRVAYFQVRDDDVLQPGSDKTSPQLVLRDILLRPLHLPFSKLLADAAEQGDLAAVNLLLAENPGLVNSTNGNAL